MDNTDNTPMKSDQDHFTGMLLKELAWKLDREVWAHVQNLSPSEEWSTSKAREKTRELITEYIGDFDKLKAHADGLEERLKWAMQFVPAHELDGFQEPTVNNEVI